MQKKASIARLVCLDIETLGTGRGAFIYQVGLAAVDINFFQDGEPVPPEDSAYTYAFWDYLQAHKLAHYIPKRLKEQAEAGGFDSTTLAFHMPHRVTPAVHSSHQYNAIQDCFLTAEGAPDRNITKTFYIAQNLEFDFTRTEEMLELPPGTLYQYSNTLDIRALQNVNLIASTQLSGKTHIAVEDAIVELRAVVASLLAGKFTLNLDMKK